MSACQCGSQEIDPKAQQLSEVLAEYSGQKGSLIPVLQKAQGIYGYLPKEVLKQVAVSLKMPFSQVYGVATFYAQFRLRPRGRNVIRVCLGTACHVRGGEMILETIENELKIGDGETTDDLRFTLESVACMGACALGPVIRVNDDTHGRLTPSRLSGIFAQYE